MFSNVPRLSRLPGDSGLILHFRPSLQGQGAVSDLQVSHIATVFGVAFRHPTFLSKLPALYFLSSLVFNFLPSLCDLDNEVKVRMTFGLVSPRSSSLHSWKESLCVLVEDRLHQPHSSCALICLSSLFPFLPPFFFLLPPFFKARFPATQTGIALTMEPRMS